MDRNKKTILEIIGILVGFILISVIAYFVGSGIAKTFLKAGGVSHASWEKHFMALVRIMGVVSCLFTLGWYFSARFFLKITGPDFVGKRMVWSVIGMLNLLSCIVVPFFYVRNDTIFKMDVTIYILFILLFGLIGYYICSIMATPACYKYTPLGAKVIREVAYKKRRSKE